jgi:hypothetical protein
VFPAPNSMEEHTARARKVSSHREGARSLARQVCAELLARSAAQHSSGGASGASQCIYVPECTIYCLRTRMYHLLST